VTENHQPLALSTMYFQRWPDSTDLRPFFALGREIGFEAFELSHILSAEAVAAIDPREVRIASVHHPCPVAANFDPQARLTSSDAAARARAADDLRCSIDTAAALGARAVVVHLGYVEDDDDRTLGRLRFELSSRHAAGLRGLPAYEDARRRLVDLVVAAEPAHLERALVSLPSVLAYAADRDIALGLETGYHAHDLPTPAGFRILLDTLSEQGCGAWLDTGHVGTRTNLGVVSDGDWYEAVAGRWIGAHLHDVVGQRDHLAPGSGNVEFAAVAAHLPPDALLTVEVDYYFSPEELAAGAARLTAAGLGRLAADAPRPR